MKSTVLGWTAVASAGLLPTGCAEYERRTPKPQAMTDKEFAILRAIAETLLPKDGTPEIDAWEAQVPYDVDRYMTGLDPEIRGQIGALLQLFEHGPLLFMGKFVRFTGLATHDREAYLLGWERSRLFHRRLAMKAVKGLVAMSYYEHPTVTAALGVAPACTAERMPLR